MRGMGLERGRINWTALAALAAIGILLFSIATYFDMFGTKDARLRPIEPQANPAAVGQPTWVVFENVGEREGAVVGVRLHGGRWIETPRREHKVGAGDSIHVNFIPRVHYDKRQREFELAFRPPRTAPPGETTSVIVSIVEPTWVGLTYDGKLTLTYNGRREQTFDVEVDVLAESPGR